MRTPLQQVNKVLIDPNIKKRRKEGSGLGGIPNRIKQAFILIFRVVLIDLKVKERVHR